MNSFQQRCPWCGIDPLYVKYHDEEWGVPVHDDQKLFELLQLEGAQAGLSWIIVLRKRESYRAAFHNFDPHKIARYTETDVARLMANPGIIRNGLKVTGTIASAKAYLDVLDKEGSFDNFLWQFVDGRTIRSKLRSMSDIQSTSPESDHMSKTLKKRGFKFIGSTICYAFMQASGMFNDHLLSCYRYKQV